MTYGKLTRLSIALCVIAVLAHGLSIAWFGLFTVAGDELPAFDNAYLHVARARVILDTGHYPEIEIVFGGVTKTYHVPYYPAMVAGFASLSGLDVFWAVRFVSIIQIILFGLAFYTLGKKLSGGNPYAGAAAAFLAYNSIALLQWGTRNTAISFGVVMVLFALYAVLEGWWLAALLLSLSIALDHPPSLLVLCLSLFIFAAATTVLNAWRNRENLLKKIASAIDWLTVACGLTAFVSYIVWHIRQTGWTCLDFKCLPQAGAREFGKSIDVVGHAMQFPAFFAPFGIAVAALDKRIGEREKIMLFAWLIACLVLVKNDALGVGVFTERFLSFLDEPLAVAGGLFIGLVVAAAAGLDFNKTDGVTVE